MAYTKEDHMKVVKEANEAICLFYYHVGVLHHKKIKPKRFDSLKPSIIENFEQARRRLEESRKKWLGDD